MRSLEFEDVLIEKNLVFAEFIDEEQKQELRDFWHQLREEKKDNISVPNHCCYAVFFCCVCATEACFYGWDITL